MGLSFSELCEYRKIETYPRILKWKTARELGKIISKQTGNQYSGESINDLLISIEAQSVVRVYLRTKIGTPNGYVYEPTKLYSPFCKATQKHNNHTLLWDANVLIPAICKYLNSGTNN